MTFSSPSPSPSPASSYAFPSSYGCVLLTAVLLCLHYLLHMLPVSAARKKYFNKEFFKENFPGLNASRDGYPDTGSGIYASKLDIQSWIHLNNAQRVHLNYLEYLPAHLIFLLTAGIHYPLYSVTLGWIFMIGRMLYTLGYLWSGAEGRGIGAKIAALATFLLFLSALASAYQLCGGIQGFIALLQA